MKSLVGTAVKALENKAPVPYVGRGSIGQPRYRANGSESQLRAMGSVGTLFSIVDRNATSVSAVDWHLYRKAKPGQRAKDREEVTKHAALDVWDKPNPFFTQQLLVETGQQFYELIGEEVFVVARNPSFKLPLELWPVRPDRMHPIPGKDEYLVGWVYTSPDGLQIPLQLDEVIQIRRPNPIDPYRGIGAVQTILADLEGVALSAEWNRNFFANSAEPGGIVEIERRLSDDEFEELTSRWREQHQGTGNAHRVAILEQAKWVDRKYSMRDMQFAEMRAVSSKIIREAFGMPAFALGEVQDINRATAEAASVWFAEQITVPRLERIKQALNSQFLPMFGTTGKGLEFDYDSPIPVDREAEDRELESKARAAQILIDAGVYGPEALATAGLPDMSFGEPGADKNRELLIRLVTRAPLLAPTILPMLGFEVPDPPSADAPSGPPQAALAARLDLPARPAPALPAVDARARKKAAGPPAPDVAQVKVDHQEALDRLLGAFEPVVASWIDDLAGQIELAVDGGEAETLGSLALDVSGAAEVIRKALAGMAQTAAARMVEECAAEGVDVSAPAVDEALRAASVHHLVAFGSELVEIATAVAQVIGNGLSLSAAQEAVRLFVPGADGAAQTGSEVAGKVKGFLSGLKGQFRSAQLSAVLHRATNVGRLATLKVALKVRPDGRIFATEVNDKNRCKPCEDLDGTEFVSIAEAQGEYAGGPYWACQGREKCRGTFYVTWKKD